MKAIIIVIIILLSQTESIRKQKRNDAAVAEIKEDISCINEKIKLLNGGGKSDIKFKKYDEKFYYFAFKELSVEWNKFAKEINKSETIKDYSENKISSLNDLKKFRHLIEALYNVSQNANKKEGQECIKTHFENRKVFTYKVMTNPITDISGLQFEKITIS